MYKKKGEDYESCLMPYARHCYICLMMSMRCLYILLPRSHEWTSVLIYACTNMLTIRGVWAKLGKISSCKFGFRAVLGIREAHGIYV